MRDGTGFCVRRHAANPLAFPPKCDSILHTPTIRHYILYGFEWGGSEAKRDRRAWLGLSTGGYTGWTGSRLVCRMERGFVFGGHAANPLAIFPKCDSILHTPTTRHYMSLNSMCVCVWCKRKARQTAVALPLSRRPRAWLRPRAGRGCGFNGCNGKRV